VVENFAKILRPKTHTPEFSRNFRSDHPKFGENFELLSRIYDKLDFQSVSRRPGEPETQTNISINGGPKTEKTNIEYDSNGGAFSSGSCFVMGAMVLC
jgi:hypothetical protein